MQTLEMVLTHHELGSYPARRAAAEAFGLEQATMGLAHTTGNDLTLHVTTAQFGLFVVLRNTFGGRNSIKALEPQLIMHPRKIRIDCTDRRAA